jgi:hypothetical protein
MSFAQCELPLFVLKSSAQPSKPAAPRRETAEKVYWTTSKVVQLLSLRSPSSLYKARDKGSAYRSDRYIAVPAGHNRWEVFRRWSA